MLLLLLAPPAFALTITGTSCTVQADNVLRYNCASTTDVSANSWVRFCQGSSCSPLSRTSTVATGGTSHAMTMYNLRAGTTYTWQGVASTGGPPVYGPVNTFTTGSLPAELSPLAFSVTGSPGPLVNVLFPFAHQYTTTTPDYDWLVITDTSGYIVWYLDPSLDTGSDLRISGLSVTRPDHHVLAILGNHFVAEYAFTGELLRLYCHDEGSGLCLNSVAADAVFGNYVSHDVALAQGKIWVLNSSNEDVDDPNHCYGGDTTSPVIVDGVYGFDVTDDSLDVDWAMSDIYDLDYGANPETCGGPGYWDGFLTGNDYTHANSIFVDANDGMTISLDKQQDVIYVDGDSGSGTFGDLMWTIAGDDAGDDFTRTATAFDDDFGDQHSVFWTQDATLLLLDNHRGGTYGNSRGIELDVDFTYGTTEILNEYNMGVWIATGGSAFDLLPSGNVLVTSPYQADNTSFKEFDATNNVVWSMTLTCTGAGCVRTAPSYRGIANLF